MIDSTGKPVSDAPLVGLIGNCKPMRHVYRLTRLAAKSIAPVLLLGEPGTGKNLFAEALHGLSAQSDSAKFYVNCSEYSDHELMVQLFGASSADDGRNGTGYFQQAVAAEQGGTIFLDEIHAMPLAVQIKLLRGMRDPESGYARVRLIASSNTDLRQAIEDGRFREDLFWQLNVVPIKLPPLRRRRDDIKLLVKHFLKELNQDREFPVNTVRPDALDALVNYQWPGNVSELQNYIRRALVLAEENEITKKLLPNCVVGDSQASQELVFRPTDEKSLIHEYVFSRLSKSEDSATDLHDTIVCPVEKELIAQLMESHTQIKAAERMGINRNTLSKKLKEYGLDKSKKEEAKKQSAKT